ncbi:MAG: SDR family NAD(P)-dependent oxidoreductase [Pseudomonadota bacterium]
MQFKTIIENLYKNGVRYFVELGPNKFLSQFVKDTLSQKEFTVASIDGGPKLSSQDAFWRALAILSSRGIPVDYQALWSDFAVHEATPTAENMSKAHIFINGSNIGKPYPPKGGFAALPGPNPEKTKTPKASTTDAQQSATAAYTTPQPSTTSKARVTPALEQRIQKNTATVQSSEQNNAVKTMTEENPLSQTTIYPTAKPSTPTDKTMKKPTQSSNATLSAIAAIHESLHKAETAFQDRLSESHRHYLNSTEEIINVLLSGTPPADNTLNGHYVPPVQQQIVAGPPTNHATDVTAHTSQTIIDPTKQISAPLADLPKSDTQSVPLESKADTADIQHQAMVQNEASHPQLDDDSTSLDSDGIAKITLDIVADKTGYPVDMIDLHTDLEAGLGIDSIKRVEILSEIQEVVPGLENIDTTQLTALNTLAEIQAFIGGNVPGLNKAGAEENNPQQIVPVEDLTLGNDENPQSPSVAKSAADYTQVILAVVAEKTGYPVDMLDQEADLEAGLGIDSIKRVEILSAFQEQVPEVAELDTTQLTALNTIRDIVDYASAATSGTLNDENNENNENNKSAVVEAAAVKKSDPGTHVKRYTLVKQARKLPGRALKNLKSDKPLAILSNNQEIALGIQVELRNAGIETQLIDELNPSISRLVYIHQDSTDFATNYQANETAFCAARQIANSNKQDKLFVTVNVRANTASDLSLDSAFSCGLSGLVKTADKEWQNVGLKTLAIENATHPGLSIAEELLEGGDELEVFIGANQLRQIVIDAEQVLDGINDPVALNSDEVVVVSGGLKGVTADCLAAFSQSSPCQLVVIGRSAIIEETEVTLDIEQEVPLKKAIIEHTKRNNESITPIELNARVNGILSAREIKQNWQRLEALGSRVHYFAGDITDANFVATTLTQVRNSIGKIVGVIHGAGVLADKKIADKKDQQFAKVFSTKIRGLKALSDNTQHDELRLFACFSSIAARKGNAGQADYAMANEILNTFCRMYKTQHPACITKSFNWGPWDGGMVSDTLKTHFKNMGVELIPLQQGAHMFAAEMQQTEAVSTDVLICADATTFAANQTASAEEHFDILVNEKSFPCLNSHIIKGIVVIPMVLATELGVRAAKTYWQQSGFVTSPHYEISNLKITKGILIEDLKKGQWIQLCLTKNAGNANSVDIQCKNGAQLYYQYRVSRLDSPPALPNLPDLPQSTPWTMQADTIYQTILFHGEHFHVIDDLTSISDSSATCRFTNKFKFTDSTREWTLDVAMLDGAVQASALWKVEKGDKDTLPLGFEKLIVHKDIPYNETLTYTMHVRDDQNFKMICDVFLFNRNQEVVYEIKGLINQAAPNKNIYHKAFEVQ